MGTHYDRVIISVPTVSCRMFVAESAAGRLRRLSVNASVWWPTGYVKSLFGSKR